MADLSDKDARRVAGIEVSALALAGVLPSEGVDGAVVGEPTAIHDLNGEVLFYRLPLVRGREQVAFVDIGAHPAVGDPMMGVSAGLEWRPESIIGEAREHAKRRNLKVEQADEVRFVAYSYPKIAVQFLAKRQELAMLEWMTWEPVPATRRAKDRRPLEPENFERWSLIEETPAGALREREKSFRGRLSAAMGLRLRIDPTVISPFAYSDLIVVSLYDTREIRYSLRASYHTPCYELRGQETNVWCVGASAQMLLDFYRYEYTQTRLAQQLGLGTPSNPNGLPYSQVAAVVTALEALTSNGLDATMITNPGFNLFRDEIRENRPLISFVPGHSRTVAGYRQALIAPLYQTPYRGLLVYDPWPPNAGVITKWENFATQTYQYAYSAKVKKI